MKPLRLGIVLVILAAVLTAVVQIVRSSRRPAAAPMTVEKQQIRAAVQQLWQRLDTAAASGDATALGPLFDQQTAGGRTALQHAEARLAYVQAWATARSVRWLPPVVTVRTPSIRVTGNRAIVKAVVSEAWSYVYGPPRRPQGPPNAFGLGRPHWITLEARGGTWTIARDSFIDPLDQDTRIPGPATPSVPTQPAPTAAVAGTYDAATAVAYANRYCGSAPGCGNAGRYNAQFYDYDAEGGDCTNFVSQVLAIGGHLARTARWTFDASTGQGTAAWVQAPTLVKYLIGAGDARVVAQGAYAVVAPAVARARPGSVIAYVEGGRPVHMAVIVGFDNHHYALVDSHSADRYHVPWDLGWDRNATFILLDITGQAPAGPLPAAPFVRTAGVCGATLGA